MLLDYQGLTSIIEKERIIMRRFTLALLLCLIMLVPALKAFSQDATQPGAASDAVKLQYIFTAGDEYRNKIVVDVDVDLLGQIPEFAGAVPKMTIKTIAVIKTKVNNVLQNGDAEISQQIESMSTDTMGQVQNISPEKLPTFTAVMSPNGALKNFKGLDEFYKLSPAFMGLSGLEEFGGGLPLNAVKTGDTWTQELPTPVGSGKIKVDSELLDANAKLGNYNAAIIREKTTGDLDMSTIMPSIAVNAGTDASSQPAPKMTVHLSMEGKLYFSPDQGRLVRTESSGVMQMNMSPSASDPSVGMMNPMNVSFPIKMEMSILP